MATLPVRAAGNNGHIADHNVLHADHNAWNPADGGTVAGDTVFSGDVDFLGVSRIASGPFADVTNSAYGAVLNGVTDDRPAIQDAIDTVDAAGGGVVLVPGVAGIDSPGLVIPTGVIVQGVGKKASRLKLLNGADSYLVSTDGFDALTGGNTAGGPHQFGLRDITLDGNRAGQTVPKPALAIYGHQYLLDNVDVIRASAEGIYSEWSDSLPAPVANVSMEALLRNVFVNDCAQHGINWNGPHDSTWQDVVAWENSQTPGYSGLVIQGPVGHPFAGGGVRGFGCHSWGTNHSYAFYVKASGCRFVACFAEGATVAQVAVDANDIDWDGLVFNPALSATTYGFAIGTTGARGAYRIRGATQNFRAGKVINFVADAGTAATIDLSNYATYAGSPITGTPSTATSIAIRSAGGQGSYYRLLPLADRPTVTGSRAGNAALADALTELVGLGLIVDSSTA